MVSRNSWLRERMELVRAGEEKKNTCDGGEGLEEERRRLYERTRSTFRYYYCLSLPPSLRLLLHRQQLQCQLKAPLATFGGGDSLRVEINIVRQEWQ